MTISPQEGSRSPQRQSVDQEPLPLTSNTSPMPIPSFSYTQDGQGHYSGGRLDATPPGTPSERLLEHEKGHVQFASYRKDGAANNHHEKSQEENADPNWLPLPLRRWFWVPLVVILMLGAIGLEIALHYSKRNLGWPSSDQILDAENILHYVYTLPPVAVAAIIVAMWAWVDIEIKKMQPYVDLVHGDSPPHRSLLLDYTRYNNFYVWTRAAANKHYVVTLATLMVLLSLAFQPLASAILEVRDTWFAEPGINVNNLATLGLNQDIQFQDLTSFLTASGYAGASVLYNLGDPPFIHGKYTIAPFQMPTWVANNGSVLTNTTAVKSETGCQPVSVNMSQLSTGWNNSVTLNGCSISWAVDRNTTNLFGSDIATCNPETPSHFSPAVFWFFTYSTVPPRASATICWPRIELWDVAVTVDIRSRNLTAVRELRPFSTSSNFSSLSANLTGPPLNGQAYNGIRFNLTDPSRFVLLRNEALQLQLPAAVYQAAVQHPGGLIGSFDADRFVTLVDSVYGSYLSSVASTVYFLPNEEPMSVEVRTFRKRVWLSDIAVHLLTASMLLLSLSGTIIQIVHRHERRRLRLQHEPGTIASAVAFGAQTGMGELLAGRQRAREIDDILRDKRFRIDPNTMKIVMEGEDGYEVAASPINRRTSIFAALQSTKRGSRRFSTHLDVPTSPHTPPA